jgi:hypothetical protein
VVENGTVEIRAVENGAIENRAVENGVVENGANEGELTDHGQDDREDEAVDLEGVRSTLFFPESGEEGQNKGKIKK